MSANEDIGVRIRLLRVQQFLRDTNQASQGINKIDRSARKADGGFTRLAGSTNKLTHGFGVLHRMSYLVSVGITGLVGDVGYASLTFEQQMAKVAAINETTLQGVSGLSEAAIQFGQDTRFSATEAAQAMYELTAAGVGVNDVTKVLAGTLDLAAATGYDLASSAETQTQVINSFGLSAEQSTKVADILTQAVNTSALKMDDLGTSFKYVGAVSQLLNFSLEDVTTALALMAKGGQVGSQAGTALNTGFLRLLKPSKQVVEALDRLGISLADVQGEALPDILDEFREAQGRVTDEVYAGATATIFGLNAIDGLEWIRLLYLYPTTITDDVLDAIAESEKVCRYIDLPLQHASAAMLKRMRRPGNRATYDKLLTRIRGRVPGVTLRTTFIVGFPGEAEADFAELESFVEETQFDHVGVFTYSHEEGTRAFSLADDVPARVKRKRRDALMARQRRIVSEAQARRTGSEINVMIDGPSPEHELVLQGRTEGQAPDIDAVVYLTDCDPATYRPGELIRAQVVDSRGYDLIAAPAEVPAAGRV